MLDFTLDPTDSILYLRPKSALVTEDFTKLAATVDPYIETTGPLAGVLVDAPAFPGWDSFAALVAHIRFVHNHHKHIKKIALVTDSPIANIVPRLASHFISAEIKHFLAGQITAAQKWILSPTPTR